MKKKLNELVLNKRQISILTNLDIITGGTSDPVPTTSSDNTITGLKAKASSNVCPKKNKNREDPTVVTGSENPDNRNV